MKTVYSEALKCIESGTPFALVTVIHTWGSAPRKAGAHMLITVDRMSGSVSGGCVENDVFTKAQEVIQNGKQELVHYGVSDEDAWQVGLSCGGKIDVLIEPFDPANAEDRNFWQQIRTGIEKDTGAAVIHVFGDAPSSRAVILAGEWNDEPLITTAQTAYNRRAHVDQELEGSRYFIEIVPPRQKLLIFGAAHVTAELVNLAHQFDFETVVIDPRGFFTNNTAFDHAPDQLHTAWPAEVLADFPLTSYTYAVTLSHDPKIDDQALHFLLRSDVAYVGALGSKKTHAKRVARLQAAGFSEEEIAQIHAPVGIDIHAQSAKEIALSVMADLISEKNKYVH